MWNFLKKILSQTANSVVHTDVGPGAISPGTPEEIASKIQFKEIVASVAPVQWLPLDTTKLPQWPGFNQNGSGSCVACARALRASIMYFIRTNVWVLFSFGWIYNHRNNKPDGGMVGTDAGRIESNIGHIPNELMPSDNLSDSGIADLPIFPWYYDIAKIFQMSDVDILLPIGDIDTLASVMKITGKPINVWFRFTYAEWTSVPTIKTNDMTLGHSVTFVPPKKPGDMVFGIYNGRKAIVIQDSWGPNATDFGMLRIITEDFFRARNIYAEYKMRFKFDQPANKPKFTGTTTSLQDCLKFDGEFPTNVTSTGFFGAITKAALIQFQTKNNLIPSGMLDQNTLTVLYAQFG